MKKRIAQKGNALTEYGFIAAMLAIAGISVLVLTGDSVSQVLGGLKSDFQNNIDATADAATLYSGSGGSGMGGRIPAPRAGQSQICYDSGWCVNVPSAQTGTGATTGTMGDRISKDNDLLRQVSAQAEAASEADKKAEKFAKMLTEMANAGDALALAEAMIAANCPAGSICVMDPAQVTELQKALMVFKGLKWDYDAAILKEPDALPADVKTMVESRAVEIITIGENMLGGADETEAKNASKKTEVKSSDICTQGVSGQCDASQATVDAAGQEITPAPAPATEPATAPV